MEPKRSPFLHPGSRTTPDSLAIILLSRDNLLPVYPKEFTGEHDGYAEGVVLNTRYGSFPHSTLLNVPWGSQVRASAVDTGSRGRKRKRNAESQQQTPADTPRDTPNEDSQAGTGTDAAPKKVDIPTSSSGFVHILAPTPELWTMSLPHRTQVVYTPDYSYILQRIRARPGTKIIEAGAGSGSFTHASVRAVYNGYPTAEESSGGLTSKRGKVFSYEFNPDRYAAMKKEIGMHGLEGLVHLTHRDVYTEGFCINGQSPEAEAVFLDLPAPWEAIQHLTRRKPAPTNGKDGQDKVVGSNEDSPKDWVSPLNGKQSVYICTFSPCVEQVTRTVSAMRRLGWVNIEVVEIANRRLYVSRERISLRMSPDKRGVQHAPRDVNEALGRLRHIHDKAFGRNKRESSSMEVDEDGDEEMGSDNNRGENGAAGGVESGSTYADKPWMDGQLITRTEGELKSHTSYLVFAILPREWTEEDEAEALKKWPVGKETGVIGALDKKARKEEKRKMHVGKKNKAAAIVAEEAAKTAAGDEQTESPATDV
ncbi:uncharacterized protein E0L32_006220 [Thyridium curvatum]|uniref:tRNA (adenine(58)-N(1))-methyltransferase catalytic subunit TRM61 n=1 Tax=Thyridium curvatum TaxID=1093900 RepID=A0A507BA65_9PEZI|nr:uncharacterized protein E0L32_006220 [Thyridium curvatum]TPX13490.1 hypothetical protein E0L32_006220 [Thyridium curvatum]